MGCIDLGTPPQDSVILVGVGFYPLSLIESVLGRRLLSGRFRDTAPNRTHFIQAHAGWKPALQGQQVREEGLLNRTKYPPKKAPADTAEAVLFKHNVPG